MTISKIQLRRGTAAAWTAANPVLDVAETGYETDTKRRKTGDGTTAWNSLAYNFDSTIANGAYASLRPSAAVFIGNSFTAHAAITSGAYLDNGWWVWFQAFSGQCLDLANVAGVTGQRIDEFTARIPTDVTPYSPGWVFVDGPTNDISQGLSLATIQANVLTMLAALAPARVVMYTIPPNNPWNSAQNIIRDQYNDWLRRLPNSHLASVLATRLIVAEAADVLTNPGANTFFTTWNTDGTHPDHPDAAQSLGYAVYTACARSLPGAFNGRLSGGNDSQNMLGSAGAFITPTSGLAAGWTNTDATNGVPSIVASTDGVTANWQRLTVASAGTSVQVYSRPGSGWAVGDTVYGSVEVRVQSLGTVSGAYPFYGLKLACIGASGTPSAFALGDTNKARQLVPSGILVLKTPPFVVATGTTNLQIALIAQGACTVDFRRARLAKVGTAVT